MDTVRCAAPIGTHHIWRKIWLDRRRISRGRWVGSALLRAAVLAQPARSKTCSTPRDLRYALADADASFKSTMQARGTDWVALSNGRGQIARSPTAKEVKPLELSHLSDLASSYPTRLPLDCCAVGGPSGHWGWWKTYTGASGSRLGSVAPFFAPPWRCVRLQGHPRGHLGVCSAARERARRRAIGEKP